MIANRVCGKIKIFPAEYTPDGKFKNPAYQIAKTNYENAKAAYEQFLESDDSIVNTNTGERYTNPLERGNFDAIKDPVWIDSVNNVKNELRSQMPEPVHNVGIWTPLDIPTT